MTFISMIIIIFCLVFFNKEEFRHVMIVTDAHAVLPCSHTCKASSFNLCVLTSF